jgi:maltose O-acetyltransferase
VLNYTLRRCARRARLSGVLAGRRLKDHLFDVFLALATLAMFIPSHPLRRWAFVRLFGNELGPDCTLERRIRLTSRGGVRIGANCNINCNVTLDGRGGIVLGDRVNVSPDVRIITAEHDPHSPTFEGREGPVHVEGRVWIATAAIILPGTKLGHGAVVGAGAVVRGQVDPWTIVAGNPARPIGRRTKGAQSQLEIYRRTLH